MNMFTHNFVRVAFIKPQNLRIPTIYEYQGLHTTDHVIDLDPTVLGCVVFAQFFSRDNLQRVVSFGCNGAWLRDTRIFADEQKDDMNVVKIESGYCANSKILSYKSHQIRTLLGPASAETGPDDGLNKAASNASL